MTKPTLEFIPLRPAVCSDKEVSLDVLIKITPPTCDRPTHRPPLNLGLVIDRSGSMSGQKIAYAREAASFVVQELFPSDRVSITIFDNAIDTLVPNTPALDKPYLLSRIRTIQSRGSTALHQGWVTGAEQVKSYYEAQRLNRVLLLSDGLANVGETNPDRIAQNVHQYASQGVSTTTLGIGADYDEDLLAAMAGSGDGNFYHIETPEQLPTIFQNELQGLMTTIGRSVTLSIRPQGTVAISRVLNRLPQTETGAYKLSNLVMGVPLILVVRLRVPAITTTPPAPLLNVTLEWLDTASVSQALTEALCLDVVPQTQWETLPENPQVQEQVLLIDSAAAREEAIAYADRGNLERVNEILTHRINCLMAVDLHGHESPEIAQELAALQNLKADLDNRNVQMMRKKMRFEAHQRYWSKPKQ